MTNLQPGHADLFFEVKFDRLAPASLRDDIAMVCSTKIDQLVPGPKRQTWLNRPYAGGSDPAALLSFAENLFQEANPTLSLSPSPKQDFYCWEGELRFCYTPFEVEENGEPVALVIESGGYQVECKVVAVMAPAPDSV